MWLSSVSVGRLYWNCLSAGARGQSLRVDAFRSTASEYASGLGELHYSSVLPFVFFSVICFFFFFTERFQWLNVSSPVLPLWHYDKLLGIPVKLRSLIWFYWPQITPSGIWKKWLEEVLKRFKKKKKNLASFTYSSVFLNPQDLGGFCFIPSSPGNQILKDPRKVIKAS